MKAEIRALQFEDKDPASNKRGVWVDLMIDEAESAALFDAFVTQGIIEITIIGQPVIANFKPNRETR